MNKYDIISMMNNINFPKSEYWLGAGASLVLHGIIEDTKDIDCGVSAELFKKYSNDNVKKAPMGGDMISINEYLDIFKEDKPSEIEYIHGIPCTTIDGLIEFYTKRGRKKDFEKINKIIDKIDE